MTHISLFLWTKINNYPIFGDLNILKPKIKYTGSALHIKHNTVMHAHISSP
jgi:hypothetical protein